MSKLKISEVERFRLGQAYENIIAVLGRIKLKKLSKAEVKSMRSLEDAANSVILFSLKHK